MNPIFNIAQNADGGCTCGKLPERIRMPLSFLNAVFNLRQDAFVNIPFPIEMLSSECFMHPIWEQLTNEQKDRVNHYGMAADDSNPYYEIFCHFVESRVQKFVKPMFCSFYLETSIDPYEQFDGSFVVERSYGGLTSSLRFTSSQISQFLRYHLTEEERESVQWFDARSMNNPYVICSFMYDGDKDFPAKLKMAASFLSENIIQGNNPLAFKIYAGATHDDRFKLMESAIVGEKVVWDAGYFLAQSSSKVKGFDFRWLTRALVARLINNPVISSGKSNLQEYIRDYIMPEVNDELC